MSGFVCVIRVELRLPGATSLKEKRRIVKSLKERLRSRFGATVAETEHQDLRQRATLLCGLVGDSGTSGRASDLERFVDASVPDGASFERLLISFDELRGL